jgi:uncharacterized protein (DUF2062 family)
MLGRRIRPHWLDQLWQIVWPRTGWRRAGTYYGHRVRRLQGSPYSIAAGFACGVAVSFTPLIGFHFLLAALTAWAIGGNIIASAIGTAAGNPWTFPFIWLATYRLGAWLLGIDGSDPAVAPDGMSISYIFDNPAAIFLPMMTGGTIFAAVAWGLSFWLVRRAVARYQHMRATRVKRRAERRAARRAARQARAAGSVEAPAPGPAGAAARSTAGGEVNEP